jgi:hypothetical protein
MQKKKMAVIGANKRETIANAGDAWSADVVAEE